MNQQGKDHEEGYDIGYEEEAEQKGEELESALREITLEICEQQNCEFRFGTGGNCSDCAIQKLRRIADEL